MNKFIYFLLLTTFSLAYSKEASNIEDFRLQVKRLGDDVEYLTKDNIALNMVGYEYKLNKKLQDGYILYLLEEYSNAAIVFYDIVSRDDLKNEIAYEEAVFYLAESLRKLGNYLGAKEYYNKVLKSPTSKFKKKAYQELLGISYKLKDQGEMEKLTSSKNISSSEIGDNIYYRKAKIYYYQGKYSKAINEFLRIKKDSKYYKKARYFIATIYVVKARKREERYENLLSNYRKQSRNSKKQKSLLQVCEDEKKVLFLELSKSKQNYNDAKRAYFSMPKKKRKRWKYVARWLKTKKEKQEKIDKAQRNYDEKDGECKTIEKRFNSALSQIKSFEEKRKNIKKEYQERKKLYLSAIKIYEKMIDLPVDDKNSLDMIIVDNSILSAARLYYTIDEIDKSIDMYQRMRRNSSFFAISLYELAWSYVKGGFYQKALYAIDLLVDVLPSSNIIPEALLLKSYLYNRMKLSDEAIVAYQTIKDKYYNLSERLERVEKEHPDLVNYFKELINEDLDNFNLESIIPKETINFIELRKDALKIKDISNSLNQAKNNIQSSKDLLTMLLDRLDNESKLFSLFPKTENSIKNSIITKNKIITVEYNLNKLLDPYIENKNLKLRKDLSSYWKEFNKRYNDDDFIMSNTREEKDKISSVQRKIHKLNTYLEQMNNKLLAIKNILSDDSYSKTQKEYFKQRLEEKNIFIKNTRKKLNDYKIRLSKYKATSSSSQASKDVLLRENIHSCLKKIRDDFENKNLQVYKDIVELNKKLENYRRKINEYTSSIRDSLSNKLKLLKKDISLEKINIEHYEKELKTRYKELIDLYVKINLKNFNYLNSKFHDLILNAEIGILEVAWKDKENLSKKIQDYYQEKKNKTNILDNEFKEILGDSQ